MGSPTEYSSISEAVNSVQSKGDYKGLEEALEIVPAPDDVIHWTDALTGLEAGATVTEEEKTRLTEIEGLYHRSITPLEDHALKIRVSSLNEFSPKEVLFMVAVRELQNQYAGKSNLNPHKFSVLLGNRYSVK